MTDSPQAAADVRPLRIGDTAPEFEARTTLGPVRLSQFRGRWLVFFSHPADFTPVCTSEFVALAKAAHRFDALDCALLGLSVDSLYSHLAWVRAIHDHLGVTVPFPIVEDPSMAIGRAYGMVAPDAADSSAVRATYFIDPDGVIQAMTWYPLSVGRSVEEMLRMMSALKRTADGSVLAPEGWRPGEPLLAQPPLDHAGVLEAAPGEAWFCQTREDR